MTKTQTEAKRGAETGKNQPLRTTGQQVCGPASGRYKRRKKPSFGCLQNRLRTINTLRPVQLFRPMIGKPFHGLFKSHSPNVATVPNLLYSPPAAKNKRGNARLRYRGVQAIQFNGFEQLFAQGHGGNMRIKLRLVNVFYYPNTISGCVL